MPYIPDLKRGPGFGVLEDVMDEPYHEYWFHLGRFIHAFAKAEFALILLLRRLSGLTKARAGAVFHGTKSEAARDLINNMLEATGNSAQKGRLSPIFAQFAAIGTIRNNLVHWGAETDQPRMFRVSNKNRNPLKPKEYIVSIDDFVKMTRDLGFIVLILTNERSDFPIVWRGSWQYIPPPQNLPSKTKGRGRAKSRPQPRASP